MITSYHAVNAYASRVELVALGKSNTLPLLIQEALETNRRVHVLVDRGAEDAAAGSSELLDAIHAAAPTATRTVFEGGESHKHFAAVLEIVAALTDLGVMRRSEPVILVGGGAFLDTAGLAVALYRRGVPHIRVPTTLTAMIDAAVGFKCAINHHGNKNLVGTFNPPDGVVIDPSFLASGTRPQLADGIAEMVKIAMVLDEELFELLESHLEQAMFERFQSEVGRSLIWRAAQGHARYVWADPFEGSLERALDFGHSFSKVLEQRLAPRPTHGQAVSIDMAWSSVLSHQAGLLSSSDLRRCLHLLARAGLPTSSASIPEDVLREAVRDTLIHRDGSTLFPLPRGVGQVAFRSLQIDEVMAVACR